MWFGFFEMDDDLNIFLWISNDWLTSSSIFVQNSLLQFGNVINTKQQVVAGTVYYITLEATDGGSKKVYEAKIWTKPWLNFQELQEFKLIGEAWFPLSEAVNNAGGKHLPKKWMSYTIFNNKQCLVVHVPNHDVSM